MAANDDLPISDVLAQRLPPDLPVTGGWRVGDPEGERQWFDFPADRPFALQYGGHLHGARLAYETWGTLNADGSNAVLVCHALTGDSHAKGSIGPGHATDGWWNGFIGSGRVIDTDRYFVVCANVLGGCQGSTGPTSINPATDDYYGPDCPVVSIRDIVRSQELLADHLGITSWHAVVGGSMGGMQALEWAIMFPDRLRSLILMATAAAATPAQIAWSAVERVAILLDPRYRGGHYYDAKPGDGPHAGVALARQIAMISYRTDAVMAQRFGREVIDPLDAFGLWSRFEVEGYLDHNGQKLARRFDANSYLVLNRAMDLHDICRGRNCSKDALARVNVPTVMYSIDSDILYPPYLQAELVDGIRAAGNRCDYHVIESIKGHDGFLLEADAIAPSMAAFLAEFD